MNEYEWEIAYLNPDALQLVLRLTYGSRRDIPMIIFDTGQMYGWMKGDKIAVGMTGMNPAREVQKSLNQPMSEEDYILTNERTGGKAVIRKNDYECENAFVWLEELKKKGIL